LFDEIHDRSGSFGGETRSGAPEVAVQHEIAEDADAFTAEAGDQAFQARDGIGDIVGHAGSLIFLTLDKLVLNDLCFFRHHDGNIVADGIHAAAGSAFQTQAVGLQIYGRFADGTDQNSEEFFRNGQVCLPCG
jgi:hypothetical protein